MDINKMCGRSTLTKGIKSLSENFSVDHWDFKNLKSNYNIFPGNFTPVLIKEKEIRVVKKMRWGLIPSWSKNITIGNNMINARSETLLEKPSFQNLINQNRCIVFSDGYFEWKIENGIKKPFYIHHHEKKTLPMAGLWTKWTSNNSEKIHSYTIITTTSQKQLSSIHRRMPVILNKDDIEDWLNTNNRRTSITLEKLHQINSRLNFHPVSSFVNSVKNNTKRCIQRVTISETISLF
jgi:putative SOS response-associated peptidase YedK